MTVPLTLRALWFRRGVSLALVVVATFVVAAAAAGPLYLRAAGESLLQDALRTAGPDAAGLEMTLVAPPDQGPVLQLASAVTRALAGRHGHGRPISAVEVDDVVQAAGGADVGVRLATRDDLCAHLVIDGSCPSSAREVVVSTRLAKRLGIRSGDPLPMAGSGRMRVVGTYRVPDEASPYWFSRAYFHPTGATDDKSGNEIGDAPFTVPATFDGLGRAVLLRAVVDVPADVRRIRLADATGVAADRRDTLRAVLSAVPEAQARTSLPELLDKAQASARLLRAPVLLVVLQLLVLAWLVLFTVMSNSVDARGPEVGLAKLRGLPTRSTVGFGLLEPLVLMLLAVPIGLAVAVVAVGALARSQLVGGIGVAVTPGAVGAAAVAVLGGALAALLAARATLTLPALEHFRRTTPRGSKRAWAADAAVVALAVAGLVQLVASGAVSGGSVDPVALLAPGLLSLAAALITARLLPAACRALAGATRGRRRLGLFLAVRQVARRPGGARSVVVLVVAFGLATFSVSAWSVARDNRHARAMTATGASQVLVVRAPDGRDTADAVRVADPSGRWAMAVTELDLPSYSEAGRKVLAVDSARLPSVAFWRRDFAGAPVSSVARALRPAAAPAVTVRGEALAVTMRTDRLAVVGGPLSTAHLSVRLVDRRNLTRTVDLGPLPGARGVLRAPIDCGAGCRLAALQVTKTTLAQVLGSFLIEGMRDAGGAVDAGLTDGGRWRSLGADDPPTLRATPEGLQVDIASAESSTSTWGPADSPMPLPAVITASLAAGSAQPQAVGLDQAPLPIAVVGTAKALPRAAADGLLVDRGYALRQTGEGGSLGTETVWLGPRAPADAVGRLSAAGLVVTAVDRAAQTESALSRQGPALALLLFLVGAAAAALLAAGGSVLDLYLLGRRRVGELAAVRALGVRRRALVSALLLEQGLLVGTGAVVGVAAGIGGALLALPSVPEFESAPAAPPLLYSPRPALIGLLVVGTLLLLGVSVACAVVGLMRGVHPDRLREGTA